MNNCGDPDVLADAPATALQVADMQKRDQHLAESTACKARMRSTGVWFAS